MGLRRCPFCGENAYFRWESIENKMLCPPTILVRFSIKCLNCNTEMKPNRKQVAMDDEFYRIVYTVLNNGDIHISEDERALALSDWNGRYDGK